ncbi:GNAT family N-acetyltransferase [Amycolatopsis nigrescens]|uniref:GNAT family N-acetyltransferase n=1 Tax=Amycolatopsis nigrescens TaxID=381445 RepID=UPI00037F9612|nr:GNAT family N-acetyltransferase [Amycolatopsis nigrescens]
METPSEELSDDQLVLRRWGADEVELAYRAVAENLEHLRPWTAWTLNGYTERDAAEFITNSRANWDRGEAFDYAIRTVGGELVGGCGLMARIGPGGLEIGYWLGREHTGRGLVTKASALLVAEAFRVGADHVQIVHDVRNVRSRGVPQRLGFREVARKRTETPLAPAESGEQQVWQRDRD